MLDEHRTPRRFWAEAVNTACYVSNQIYLRVHKKKTCYELMHDRTPKVSHFHVFGCKCFILNEGKKLDKFKASTTRFSPYCNKSLRQHHYFGCNRGYYCTETVIWLQFVCLLQHKI
jgi:hypothetical protein